jgi:hypothetical protein
MSNYSVQTRSSTMAFVLPTARTNTSYYRTTKYWKLVILLILYRTTILPGLARLLLDCLYERSGCFQIKIYRIWAFSFRKQYLKGLKNKYVVVTIYIHWWCGVCHVYMNYTTLFGVPTFPKKAASSPTSPTMSTASLSS